MLENSKHEKFVQLWHSSGNKSEAYRESHPVSKKWKDATVHNKASELSRRGEVLARFDQLKEQSLKDHGITIASLLEELDEARALAMTAETPQTSSAINATMNKAKLVGLDKNTLEVTNKVKSFEDMYD
tara:strand:- start:1183 stop:1569 length:387 start_codon:yes stop_codon:yes gene_type:complete